MVEKVITPGRNVVDFLQYQQGRKSSSAKLSVRSCRHCGAALGDGEAEEECSSAGFNVEAPGLRKFYAE